VEAGGKNPVVGWAKRFCLKAVAHRFGSFEFSISILFSLSSLKGLSDLDMSASDLYSCRVR